MAVASLQTKKERNTESVKLMVRFISESVEPLDPWPNGLHWLPVKQRVDYKLATLVYKSLRGQAPSYLVDD